MSGLAYKQATEDLHQQREEYSKRNSDVDFAYVIDAPNIYDLYWFSTENRQ